LRGIDEFGRNKKNEKEQQWRKTRQEEVRGEINAAL
jgi:hypothetical protein